MAVRVKPVSLTIRNEWLLTNVLPVLVHCIALEHTVLLREYGVILSQNEELPLFALHNPVDFVHLKRPYLHIVF
jgi:hypothetical protein